MSSDATSRRGATPGGDEWRTASGIPLRPVYGPDDVSPEIAAALGAGPGQAPYLRGAYPGMYRTKPWRIFQLSGFGSPEDLNARIRFLLERGETGFIMKRDRMTADHLYDVDHPDVVARREDVGLTGTVLLSVRDTEVALAGIPIQDLYAHPGAGVVQLAPFGLSCYWTVARRRGCDLRRLAGTGQSDFFLTYLGCFPKQQIPARAGLRLNLDLIEFCTEHLPRWVPVSVAGYNGADTGLNAWQELGAVMANTIEYLDGIRARGRRTVAEVAHGVGGISLRTSMDFFEDVAKLRAARKLWHDLLRDRYGVTDERALRLRIHVVTAGSAMTYQQPLNNLVRGTLMALVAALGGTQSLGVSGYDEALSIPSDHAHQMSIRIQQILQQEINLPAVADPLGGSYLVEHLTGELVGRARAFLEDIQGRGGFIETLDTGWLHQRAAENQASELRDLADGRKAVVGVTCFTEDEPLCPIEGFVGSSDAWERGMVRLKDLRASRSDAAATAARRALARACRQDGNLIPAMMEAVAADVTLGEVGEIFREAFGVWKVPVEF